MENCQNGYTTEELICHGYDVFKVEVTDPKRLKKFNFPTLGESIVISTSFDEDIEGEQELALCIKEQLEALLKGEFGKRLLIVGMGNPFITADSLGPTVIDMLNLKLIGDTYREDCTFEKVYGLIPGVLGQTNIDRMDYLTAVIAQLHIEAVLFVDSLVTSAIDNLCSNIQINNIGMTQHFIYKGSFEVNRETLKMPVYAIGMPTVFQYKDHYLMPRDGNDIISRCAASISTAILMLCFPTCSYKLIVDLHRDQI